MTLTYLVMDVLPERSLTDGGKAVPWILILLLIAALGIAAVAYAKKKHASAPASPTTEASMPATQEGGGSSNDGMDV